LDYNLLVRQRFLPAGVFPMTVQLSGVIHGKTIELNSDPGLADGQVLVVVSESPKVNPQTGEPWGAGFYKTAGAFADDPNAEKYIQEILAARKKDAGREIPD
jgi:hypothetical protein